MATGGPALTPAIVTWLRLMRVHTRVAGRLTAFLGAWGLSLAQFDALAQVYADEGLCQQDLAARLMETKGNISRLLDRMQARGLLERRSDGHANRLYLTAKGLAFAEDVIPAQNAAVTRILAALPPADRAQLHTLLRRLDHALLAGSETSGMAEPNHQTGDQIHE
jgi:DNA-binding MarR family transcriptional regulator